MISQSICEEILEQKEAYKEIYKEYPRSLIVNWNMVDKICKDYVRYVIKTEGEKFQAAMNGNRQILGMNFIIIRMQASGGVSFTWGFGD